MWNEVSWHGLIRLDMDMEHALFSFVIFVGKCNLYAENDDFHQWAACEALIPWFKYIILGIVVGQH